MPVPLPLELGILLDPAPVLPVEPLPMLPLDPVDPVPMLPVFPLPIDEPLFVLPVELPLEVEESPEPLDCVPVLGLSRSVPVMLPLDAPLPEEAPEESVPDVAEEPDQPGVLLVPDAPEADGMLLPGCMLSERELVAPEVPELPLDIPLVPDEDDCANEMPV